MKRIGSVTIIALMLAVILPVTGASNAKAAPPDVLDLGLSGVANDGTLIGNTSLSTDARLGIGALRSEAASGAPETTRMSVGGDLTDLDMTSSYTYMAWVKILSDGAKGIIGLGACCSTPAGGTSLQAREGYTLNYQGGGRLRYWGGSSNANRNHNLNTGNVLNLNQYHHVAVRVQPANVQIFVDGVSVASGRESNIPTSPSKVNQNNNNTPGAPSIGGPKVDNGNTADMLIDEVRVYGSAVSDADIALIAAGNLGPLPDRLYYNFESSGIVKSLVSGPDQLDQLSSDFVAPDSITFETLNTSCGSQSTFAFELNGTALGSTPSDPTFSCTCNAPTDSFANTDSVLIASAWSGTGPNDLRFTKTGGNNATAWSRAVLQFGATTETVCVFDQGGGNCDVTNLCTANFTFANVDAAVDASPTPDGEIDLVVEVGQTETTAYDFAITYRNPDGPPALIKDTVPAEWDVLGVANDMGGLPLDCSGSASFADGSGGAVDLSRGGKAGKNCKSATKIDWMPAASGGSINVWSETRGPKKNGKFAPTSCGALMLNDGAQAFDLATGDPLLDESGDPVVSNKLCLAAVSDVNGDGMIIRDGSGDEDGDGLSDLAEACDVGTDPCVADTDGDNVPDGADACPLEAAIVDGDGDGCEDPA